MANKISVLKVFLYDRQIGTLTNLPGDKNVFNFESDYINNPQRPTLSLSFEDAFGDLLTNVKATRRRVPPFFANLLPEGLLREYLASRSHVNAQREFFLLSNLGSDLPGAITIQSSEIIESEIIKKSEEKKVISEKPLRFSLAGVQLKFSAIQNSNGRLTIPANGVGGSWIVKLPSNTYQEVPENEYSMMQLARNVGIDVPEISLVPLKDIEGLPSQMRGIGELAFIIKRFDRSPKGSIHIEDFAQVFNIFPEEKYKKASYRNIIEVLWAVTGEKGVIEFMRRFVFNALIGNGDMHLKNWSLIYPDKKNPALAPAYDFVSTIPYIPEETLALTFVDSKEFRSLTIDKFKHFATKAQIPMKLVLETLETTVHSFALAWKTVDDLPLNIHFRKQIEAHLKTIPFWKEMQ